MRIAVLCLSDFLYQKIRLALAEDAEVIRISAISEAMGHDACLAEAKIISAPEEVGGTRLILMGDGCKLPLPFTFEELSEAVFGARSHTLPLLKGDKCAYLRGERIALTEVEFALFDALYSAGGEFISREELLFRIWGGEADSGVVNVYVHYLRQKLERGERIILTSRKHGYKIDEKYFGEEKENA